MKKHELKHQHGDVLLKEIQELPKGAEPISGKTILAYGEITGHMHQIVSPHAKMFQKKHRRYLKVLKPVKLKHEEHGSQTILPGIYFVDKVRQYDHLSEAIKPVYD